MSYSAFREERYTVEEFAELELDAPEGERWELIAGRIVRMMTGGTIGHNRIVQNLVVGLRSALREKGSSCDVFSENVKFEQDLQSTATYPDVIVTCERSDNDKLAISAPVILAEVLSKTSIGRDRVEKWQQYSSAPTLRAYVLIEQKSPTIEVYSRADDGNDWGWSKLTGLDSVLKLKELDISLPLSEIYERVFDADQS